MFRPRTKKIYPPGTFIPTSARVCAIIQLCLAFALCLWYLSQPFAGDYVRIKSTLLLYEDVMGLPSTPEITATQKERLELNASYFKQLPQSIQQELENGLKTTQTELKAPFIKKLSHAFSLFLFQMPIFEKAWILFSIVISFMLLKKVDGAVQAVWLLPLIVTCYALDNRWNGVSSHNLHEVNLFPSEQLLIEEYYGKPLSADLFQQQTELKHAWNLYLIKSILREEPSQDSKLLTKQVSKGQFLFNLSRIKQRKLDREEKFLAHSSSQDSLFLLSLYLFWNFFFAYTVWQKRRFI